MVDAAVVRDAVEPRAHVDRAVVAAQRAERAHEHVLQHVLGVLARVAARASGARRRTAAGGSGRGGRRTPRRDPARNSATSCSSERRRSSEVASGSRLSRAGACSADASTLSGSSIWGSATTVHPNRDGGVKSRALPSALDVISFTVVADELPVRPGVGRPAAEIELRTSRSSGPGRPARQRDRLARRGGVRRRRVERAERRAEGAHHRAARPARDRGGAGHALAARATASWRSSGWPTGWRTRSRSAARAPRRGRRRRASAAGWTQEAPRRDQARPRLEARRMGTARVGEASGDTFRHGRMTTLSS